MPVAELAVNLLLALVNNAAAISSLISAAKSQNRDITLTELQSVIDADTLARANLVVAIEAAKSKP